MGVIYFSHKYFFQLKETYFDSNIKLIKLKNIFNKKILKRISFVDHLPDMFLIQNVLNFINTYKYLLNHL